MTKVFSVCMLLAATLLFLAGSPSDAAEVPPTTIELSIPDYTVTTVGGLDYVEIAGGDILLEEEGRPRVPYYSASIDYPESYRVQEVTLRERTGLTTAAGLTLPVVILADNPPLPVEIKGGWYPQQDFNFTILENMDGSTSVNVVVYPFYYNPDTKEVKFYQSYGFDVEYVISTVRIEALVTDKTTYQPEDKLTLDIWVNNTGDTQTILAGIAIREYASGALVDGLPLRPLTDLAGEASLAAEWLVADAESGSYYVEVNLMDGAGNILDKSTAGFSIEERKSEFPIVPVVAGIAGGVIVAGVLALLVMRFRKPSQRVG